MKKILLAAACVVSITAFAQHPTDKGWRSVGGTGSLHLDFDKSEGTNNNFGLAPEVYWFVANSFGIGSDFGIGAAFHKSSLGDTITFRSQSISMWIAPGIRFYFREPEKKWRPYAFANAGYIYNSGHSSTRYNSSMSMNTESSSTAGSFRSYGGAGLAWFFSDHAAFDIRLRVLDYSFSKLHYNPDIMIGVQAFFD